MTIHPQTMQEARLLTLLIDVTFLAEEALGDEGAYPFADSVWVRAVKELQKYGMVEVVPAWEGSKLEKLARIDRLKPLRALIDEMGT